MAYRNIRLVNLFVVLYPPFQQRKKEHGRDTKQRKEGGMGGNFHRLAVAVSFSPRREAILAEVARIRRMLHAQVTIIHVGKPNERSIVHLESLLEKYGLDGPDCKLVFQPAGRVASIVRLCREQQVELLICGAVPNNGILDVLWGSVAKRLIKNAPCSILVLAKPKMKAQPYRKIVVSANQQTAMSRRWQYSEAEATDSLQENIQKAMAWARADAAETIHVLREANHYGLAMSTSADEPEEQHGRLRRQLVSESIAAVELLIGPYMEELPTPNIKITGGKMGVELAAFARKAKADLLVMQAPAAEKLGFFWRMASPEFEHILAELPCNLLLTK